VASIFPAANNASIFLCNFDFLSYIICDNNKFSLIVTINFCVKLDRSEALICIFFCNLASEFESQQVVAMLLQKWLFVVNFLVSIKFVPTLLYTGANGQSFSVIQYPGKAKVEAYWVSVWKI